MDALSGTARARFDTGLRSLASDPYGSGSVAIRERDYRQALVGGCVTVYYVSAGVRVLSVTRAQGPP
ncbi:hypothetical protein I3J09_27580 [Streptomyces clavuligerus]|nr:hypothetical protein [Streptomyces clavuligerus]QPL66824.1 hypothetical protein I3J04_27565 [Streptomyces clavuligerus]QPL72793.1 hypothetical protein I3J05_23990 [Streptomyces clavuligerus]QPL78932.1 hypothetical protein I3J06_27580 [Streptomyces clavuligerus]QPL84959.1 hypothetical protein I3J07_27615 [Streptomyces clavuligerus]